MMPENTQQTRLREIVAEAVEVSCPEKREGSPKHIAMINRLLGVITGELEREVQLQTDRLHDQKRFFDNIISTASIFIVILDSRGNISYMNRFALELSGYVEEEVTGRNWFDMFIAEEKRHLLKEAFGSIKSGVADYCGYENPVCCRDGSERVIQWQNSLLEEGDSRQIIAMGIDVTERKIAEDRQAYLGRILHSINQASNAIIHADTELELFEKVCDILARESGYGLAWIGLTEKQEVRIVCNSEDPTGYLDPSFHVSLDPSSPLAHGPVGRSVQERQTVIIQDTQKDPGFAPWRERAEHSGFRSVMFTPLTSGSGIEPIGTMGVYSYRPGGFEEEETRMLEELASRIATAVLSYEQARQIRELNNTLEGRVEQQTSKLRQANEVLKRRLDEINEKNSQLIEAKKAALAAASAKSSFISGISHELRTPLNAIINFSDQLLEDYDEIHENPELREEGRQFLGRVLQNSRHLLDLINEILDFAKIDAGKMEYDIQPTEINEILLRAYNNFESLMRNNETVEYLLELHDRPLTVELDTKRFLQIIINLLSNAIKFTQSGHIMVRSSIRGERAVVEVADTGKGIPPDKLDTIFNPFEQVNRNDQGTGLGLVLVHKMCEAMQIGLDVDSSERKGTTFCLSIPLSEIH